MTVILDEYLELGGIDLGNYAYFTESLTPLYTVDRRGSNRLLPNVAGTRAYAKVAHEVAVSLSVRVRGQFNVDGTATADHYVGLDTHLRALETALLDDTDTTLAAVWHRPVANREADVQVASFGLTDRRGFEAVCQLDLVIPGGRWTDV